MEVVTCPACGARTGLRFVSQPSVGSSGNDSRRVVRRCMACRREWPLGNSNTDAGLGRGRIDQDRARTGGRQT